MGLWPITMMKAFLELVNTTYSLAYGHFSMVSVFASSMGHLSNFDLGDWYQDES